MAKKRKRAQFGATPSDHRYAATELLPDLRKSIANGHKQLRRGSCRVAWTSLLHAEHALGVLSSDLVAIDPPDHRLGKQYSSAHKSLNDLKQRFARRCIVGGGR